MGLKTHLLPLTVVRGGETVGVSEKRPPQTQREIDFHLVFLFGLVADSRQRTTSAPRFPEEGSTLCFSRISRRGDSRESGGSASLDRWSASGLIQVSIPNVLFYSLDCFVPPCAPGNLWFLTSESRFAPQSSCRKVTVCAPFC